MAERKSELKPVFRIVEIHSENGVYYRAEKKFYKRKYIFFGPYIESGVYVNHDVNLEWVQNHLKTIVDSYINENKVIEQIDLNEFKK